MEFDKKFNHDYADGKIVLFNNNFMKPEIHDDFCTDSISSNDFLQEFQHLDHFSTSFYPDLGIQTTGFDPFDPFSQGVLFDRFRFYDQFKPFEDQTGATGSSVMQNFQGSGFLSYPNKKKSLIKVNISDQSLLSLSSCQDVKPINFVVPDESSYIKADNSYYKGTDMKKNNNSASTSINKQGRGRKKAKSTKGLWTVEEDRLLIYLVEKYGVRKWSHIAQLLKGRIGKQCRERWHNHLRPDIKKDVWTEEEDRILVQAHGELGNKWTEIAKILPGRTENSIKNHWNATKRRQFSRRKCRTKWPRPNSLLQNYIKSLNLERGGCSRRNVSASDAETTTAITKAPPPKKNIVEFCPSDRLVPDYDFSEIPEFALDDKLFEGSSIDSFIDDMPNMTPVADEKML